MEEKKYVSLDNLTKYNELLMGKVSDDDLATLESAKEYTNAAVADKASVQICIWEEND